MLFLFGHSISFAFAGKTVSGSDDSCSGSSGSFACSALPHALYAFLRLVRPISCTAVFRRFRLFCFRFLPSGFLPPRFSI
jgi:hypothetical protein